MRQNDNLWKGLIEDLFPEFLQFFYPQAEGALAEKMSVDFLDKELQGIYPLSGKASPAMFVDKLARVRTNCEHEKWILIHVEVRGYRQRDFPQRMFNYFTRIQAKYGLPVTAIAIVMGSGRKVKDFYSEECLGTYYQYRYNVCNIHTIDEMELYKSRNPFSLIVQAARLFYEKGRIPDEELAEEYVGLFDMLASRDMPPQKKEALWAYLADCVAFEDPAMYAVFYKQLKQMTSKQDIMRTMEMLEERWKAAGIEVGIEQDQKKVVHNLLEILHLPDEQIKQVVGVDQDFIDAVKRQMN